MEGGAIFTFDDIDGSEMLTGPVNGDMTSTNYGVPFVAGNGQAIGDSQDNSVSVACSCAMNDTGFVNLGCDSNGTAADNNDDFIAITLDPTGLNLSAGYSVTIDNGATITPTTAIYGFATNFTIDGALDPATNYTLTITDNGDNACTLTYSFVGETCSPLCLVQDLGVVDNGCSDNATPSIVGDDQRSISVNPTGLNLSAGYSVTIDNGATITPTTAIYGSATNFTIDGALDPATNYTLTITDSGDNACTLTYSFVGESCSTTCLLTTANEVVLGCNDNGTIYTDERDDDFIEFSLYPDGLNLGSNYFVTYNGTGSVEPNLAFYGEATDFRLYPGSADGQTQHSITITDVSGSNCELVLDLVSLEPCSDLEPPKISNDLVDPTGSGTPRINIANVEDFPNNEFTVFNRWGRKVFEVKGYNNQDKSFVGIANTDLVVKEGTNLPAGVYFYVFKYTDFNGKTGSQDGYLYLND